MSKRNRNKKGKQSPATASVSMPAVAPTPPSQPRSLLATIKEHPVAVAASLLLSFLVGAATIVPAALLVVEKWSESVAIIDMGSVDPKKPFSAPLQIKNASTIFDMHAPAISCSFSALYFNGTVPQLTQNGGHKGWYVLPTKSVSVKDSAVFFCDFPDKFKYTNETGEELSLHSATMTAYVKYETWIGPKTIEREPPPTTFTLLNTSTGYQWVKGTLIK